MFKQIIETILNYYQFIILPFLSISILFAMEYISKGIDFFINKEGNVKWRFLIACSLLQAMVSLVIILSVIAIFKSDSLKDYQTFKLLSIILLGTTPFNISILIWVAIKLEIYRILKNRYKDELNNLDIHNIINELIKDTKDNKDNKDTKDNK